MKRQGLVKKVIVNKQGHRQTVYVKPITKLDDVKRKVQGLMKKSNYDKTLKILNSQIDKESNPRALGAKLIIMTGMRMGNLKSAEGQRMQSGDKTFGVSTLKREHIKIKPNSVRIQFKGKKGVEHDIEIKSKKLQDQIKAVYNSGYGKTLLNVSPKQLADYIKKELKVNPKDLRTLRANIIAEQESKRISKRPKPKNKSEANKELDAIANKVAEVLGNTKGVARRSYIDADILDSHRANRLKKAEIFELIETL